MIIPLEAFNIYELISMILKQFFIKFLRNRDTSVSQNQVS
jgi:hypothetical protein